MNCFAGASREAIPGGIFAIFNYKLIELGKVRKRNKGDSNGGIGDKVAMLMNARVVDEQGFFKWGHRVAVVDLFSTLIKGDYILVT